MYCTGDATAILMRNATSAGFAGENQTSSPTYQRRARERLRSISVIVIQSNLLNTLETENGHCGEGVHYGEVEVNKYDNFFLREYNVTCCDQFMLTVTSPILSWIRCTIYAFCSST